MFPIFDVHNNIIAFGGRIIGEGEPKYLNSPETILFDKHKNLYGLNIARTSKKNQIIIVEGYMDTIALHQAGFDNAVASLGTAFNVEHARLLRKYTEEVILIYDSDAAGTNAALRAIPILVSSGLRVKVLQVVGAKDPDEYLKKYGAEAFEVLLKDALSHVDFQINHIKSKYNLENTDQKIKFTTEVSVLLAGLHNAIEQDAYVKQTAVFSGISEDSIKKEMVKEINKPQKPIVLKSVAASKPISKFNIHKEKDKDQSQKGVIEAQKSLLNIISNNELVYLNVKKYLTPEKFIEPYFQKLAGKIYELSERKSNICPAELINYFDNSQEQRIVTEIFAIPIEYSSKTELEKAVNDQVKLILKTRIDTLTRQSNDIELMQQLIQDKRNLENLNITLTDG
jgi:DNA primase